MDKADQKDVCVKKDCWNLPAKVGIVVLFIVFSFLLGSIIVLAALMPVILYAKDVPVFDGNLMLGISLVVGMIVLGSIVAVCKKVVEL